MMWMVIPSALPKRIVAALAVVLVGLSLSPNAQDQESRSLQQSLTSRFGKVPHLAWVIPPNRVVAGEQTGRVYILGSPASVLVGEYSHELSDAEVRQLQEDHLMLCPPVEDARYFAYEVAEADFTQSSRAFYTTSSAAADVRVGVEIRNLSPEELEVVADEFIGQATGYVHRAFVAEVPGSDYYLSFHGLYDKASSRMFREGILLHSRDGMVHSKAIWPVEPEPPCDGCEIPDLALPLESWYTILNGFRFPGYDFPVLLRDTSTMEGRAISLVSFDTEGRFTEIREYEYVVTCILGLPGGR